MSDLLVVVIALQGGTQTWVFCESPKTRLLVKERVLPRAKEIFKDSGIQITTMGRPLLGAPLGCDPFKDSFLAIQVNLWVSELRTLATIATTQPHAAYTAFSHSWKVKKSPREEASAVGK